MRVTWEVDDGYAGKSRPQHTEVPDEELEHLTEEEQLRLIEEYIQEDFDNRMSPCWGHDRVVAELAELRARFEQGELEEEMENEQEGL